MKKDEYDSFKEDYENVETIEFNISGEVITKKAPLVDKNIPIGAASMSCKVKGSSHTIIATIASIMESDSTIKDIIMSAASEYALKDIRNKVLLNDNIDDNIEDKLKLSKLMQGFVPDTDLDIN